jgi:hypothetical protein
MQPCRCPDSVHLAFPKPAVLPTLNRHDNIMTKSARISYAVLFLVIVMVAWLKMATPLITALFAYFALCKLSFFKPKWTAILLFLVVVSGIFYGFVYFIKEAFVALPAIAEESIPRVIEYANKQGIHLPFEDLDSLKSIALENVRHQLRQDRDQRDGLCGDRTGRRRQHVCQPEVRSGS